MSGGGGLNHYTTCWISLQLEKPSDLFDLTFIHIWEESSTPNDHITVKWHYIKQTDGYRSFRPLQFRTKFKVVLQHMFLRSPP